MSRQSAPRNASHDDLHWRQRLKLENSTHDGWSASWGFMAKGPGGPDAKTSRAQLHATAAKLGPMAEYLARTRGSSVASRGLPVVSELDSARSSGRGAGAGASVRAGSTAGSDAADEELATALKLDVETARRTLCRHQHDVGFSGKADGVSPPEKYRFPQTEQQKIGWAHKRNLEAVMFNTRGLHAKKGLQLDFKLNSIS